jgi:hypothetical protein
MHQKNDENSIFRVCGQQGDFPSFYIKAFRSKRENIVF